MQFTPEHVTSTEEEVGFSQPKLSFGVLFGIAVVVMVVAIGAIFFLLIGDDAENDGTAPKTVSAPTNPVSSPDPVLDSAPLISTSTTPSQKVADPWQSEVIVHETPEATTAPIINEQSSAPPITNQQDNTAPVVREAPPLLWTNEPPIKIEPLPYNPPSESDESTILDDSSTPEPTTLQTISDRNYRDCGALTIPSGMALLSFSRSARTEPVVLCLGEAVGNSCSNYSATIKSNNAEDLELLVTEMPGGACAVGIGTASDRVSLCSVKMAMNRALGMDRTESEWRTEFEANPGILFVELFLQNQSTFMSLGGTPQYGCEEFLVD